MATSLRLALAGAGAVALVGASTALGAATGSGATFPETAYDRWGADSGLATYTGTGSGAGIADLTAGVVDFAGSDALLNATETAALAAARGGVTPVYLPTLLGAVTVPANVAGVKKPLRLDGRTIGKIFAGTLKRWSDPAIAKANPGVKLPKAAITACVRSDSSGTSFNFSTFLSRVSPEFKAKVTPDKVPAWKAAKLKLAEGSSGVSGCVKATKNSIGYVDLGDATKAGLKGKLASVSGKKAGAFVAPTTTSISAAAAGAAGLTLDLLASKAPGGYPITTTTYVVAYSDYAAAGNPRVADVKDFLTYAYSPAAQGVLPSLGYAPLPAATAQAALTAASGLH